MKVRMLELGRELESFGGTLESVLAEVLRSGRYILGPRVTALEASLAEIAGVRFCIGVASGTDALVLALRASGLQAGQTVLVPAFSFIASASAAILAGGRVAFCDVDESYNLDPRSLEDALHRTNASAVVAVHLFGDPAPVTEIVALCSRHGACLVEDAAQALGAVAAGAPVGKWGSAGCLSFYPTKVVGAAGDAGAVVTDDEDTARRLRALRNHGMYADRYTHQELGYNSRLDEMQAALLAVKLHRLPEWLERRREIKRMYRQGISTPEVTWPPERHDDVSAASVVTAQFVARDELRAYLEGQGVDTMVYYPKPLPNQPGLQPWVVGPPAPCPVAERLAMQALSLPIHPFLHDDEVDYVCDRVLGFYRGRRR